MNPVYDYDGITIYQGDCRDVLKELAPVDCVIADPPYGDTALDWDVPVSGWLPLVPLKESGSIWCFGSLKMFMKSAAEWGDWTIAQDVIWEKHNGSSLHSDRFRRVHEHVIQFYKLPWAAVYKSPQFTQDALKKTVRRKTRPVHWGRIRDGHFTSEDGGPRMMRSVIPVRSCHGQAVHPTQKPLGILAPLLEYSCPPAGVVLDPFMGSGSTLRAAKDLKRHAIGIEKDPAYIEIAIKRMSQEVLL